MLFYLVIDRSITYEEKILQKLETPGIGPGVSASKSYDKRTSDPFGLGIETKDPLQKAASEAENSADNKRRSSKPLEVKLHTR